MAISFFIGANSFELAACSHGVQHAKAKCVRRSGQSRCPVGAWLGPTTRRYRSGEVDYHAAIFAGVRCETASVILIGSSATAVCEPPLPGTRAEAFADGVGLLTQQSASSVEGSSTKRPSCGDRCRSGRQPAPGSHVLTVKIFDLTSATSRYDRGLSGGPPLAFAAVKQTGVARECQAERPSRTANVIVPSSLIPFVTSGRGQNCPLRNRSVARVASGRRQGLVTWPHLPGCRDMRDRSLFLFANGRKCCDRQINQVDCTLKYRLGLSKAG